MDHSRLTPSGHEKAMARRNPTWGTNQRMSPSAQAGIATVAHAHDPRPHRHVAERAAEQPDHADLVAGDQADLDPGATPSADHRGRDEQEGDDQAVDEEAAEPEAGCGDVGDAELVDRRQGLRLRVPVRGIEHRECG